VKKTAKTERVKKSGIRAVNQGFRYDITGSLRSLTRQIERGAYGKIGNMAVVFDTHNGVNEYATVELKHYGPGSEAEVHWLLSTAKKRMEPA
jgi:hypothetical protein